MAYIEYGRFRDFKSLATDTALRIDDVLYIPISESFEDLDIGLGDPDDAGAMAAYMDGATCKLAVYNGDGTWSRVGGDGAPTYTTDGALPTGAGFLAYLRTNYTDAKVGDVVYREGTTQLIKCTCYYVDANPSLNKWSKITEIIE